MVDELVAQYLEHCYGWDIVPLHARKNICATDFVSTEQPPASAVDHIMGLDQPLLGNVGLDDFFQITPRSTEEIAFYGVCHQVGMIGRAARGVVWGKLCWEFVESWGKFLEWWIIHPRSCPERVGGCRRRPGLGGRSARKSNT